ncbi:type I-E CRISPR-associated protein Cse1/CasA [Microbacterium tumbae]
MPAGAIRQERTNLVDELGWIPVHFLDGTTAELPIREVFHRAHEIREISGEVPTQGFAILRLLLAILYRAPGGGPITVAVWRAWQENGLPLTDLDEYLDAFRDRFELCDPERPFFQVADLATAKGERKDVAPLIFDLPSNNRLFTTRSREGAADLSFAEAARWLVNVQSFEVSGIKSGAVGDPRVKGGKGYPIGIGWAGLLGGVYAQGRTLRDTLLANLVGHDALPNARPEGDLPPWEDTAPDTAAEREGLLPHGPVRLYTWQSRRIRLFAEGDRVVGCLVANGDKLTPQNMQGMEPMSAWRYSDPQTKKAKQTTYMPREHQPGRALWRGIGALLPGVSSPVPKSDLASSLPPAVVSWLGLLDSRGYLEAAVIRLRSIGVVYGSNNSVVDEILDDQVILPVALLRERNRALAHQAEEAVRLADDGAYAVRRLAENLERAAGGTGDASGAGAIERAYAELDRPYREWLAGLGENADPLEAVAEWKSIALTVLRAVGDELISQASPAAWMGREVSRGGQIELITTPRAEGWFLRALGKTFGTPIRKDEAA